MKIRATYKPGSKRFAADLSGPFSGETPLIFLLRHGRIQGHDIRRFIGQTDVPLDHTGWSQAAMWQNAFAGIDFTRIYSSCLDRCRQTAELACPGHDIIADPRLNEIDMGAWDGHPFDYIRQIRPQAFDERGRRIDSFRPPGGESFEDVSNRAFPLLEDLPTEPGSRTLLVTHAGVMRVLLCRIQGLPLKALFSIRLEYGQLFLISIDND